MAYNNIDRLQDLGLLEPGTSLSREEAAAIDQLSPDEMQQIEALQRRLAGQLSKTDTQTIEQLRRKLQPALGKVIVPTWF